MKNKIYEETDNIGRHKVIEQPNGIKIRILREPSEWYREKTKKNAERDAVRRAEEEEKIAREKLIKDKMRELAIVELEKEGKM